MGPSRNTHEEQRVQASLAHARDVDVAVPVPCADVARAVAQRTVPIAVSFLVLTLATQSDDRVHSGRAPRRDVARQKYNDHEDHRHRDEHFRIKRSHSVEQT